MKFKIKKAEFVNCEEHIDEWENTPFPKKDLKVDPVLSMEPHKNFVAAGVELAIDRVKEYI